MRVAITFPPLPSESGVPLLAQNRQFQWFNRPTYIYPVVPATAATMLHKAGHEVFWMDGIALEQTVEEFDSLLAQNSPDLVLVETKTPVVKRHWEIVSRWKSAHPELLVVMCGDHVTAMPEESFANCPVDFILTGGDYDFLLSSLVDNLEKGGDCSSLEPGIYWRSGENILSNGPFRLDHDLRALPWIDRDLTQWRLYAEKNGNYRKIPGTYLMSGRDCWHGKCTFCSWTALYPQYRTRDPIDVVDEIGELIERYGVKEIMDDTGSFPVGNFLTVFCEEMIKRGYNRKVRIDCNMRFGRLSAADYRLMRKAGFRFLLFGLESANQPTLDRLVKAIKVSDIEEGARAASAAGLDVHVTVMFGYPWEDREDIRRTVALATRLLRKGLAYTLQVTQVVPYPSTPLFRQLKASGDLLTENWEDYDMRMQVMRSGVSESEIKEAIREVYRAFLHPETLFRRLFSTHNPISDFGFYWRGFLSLLGHLKDFRS